MGSYKPNKYYDDIYSTSEKYKCHYTHSPYFDLWVECIKYIPDSANVLEVGCGTGQFYDMLMDIKNVNYTGFDFSEVAINMHPCTNVYVGDARDIKDYPDNYGYIICKEVLEHLEDDIEVIRKWRKGVDVLITLPCFDDPAHVRWAENEEKIRNRYETEYNCLTIEKVITFDRWFIIIGKTK